MSLFPNSAGLATLSGTANSASPVTFVNWKFKPAASQDGLPRNIVTITNASTDGTVMVNVRIQGVHNGSSEFYPVLSGLVQSFQSGKESNAITGVTGFVSTLAGATTNSTALVAFGATGSR